MTVYGLLITKDDHEVFSDWCRDQLRFYERVICLDGSTTDDTFRQSREFAGRLIYRHEREFEIPKQTDHGLRRVVHNELVRLFGQHIWIMCCHTDEFCYHDPRKIAARAEREGYNLVSWFSPHFYPHPSEQADLTERLKRPVQDRFRHYHWGHLASGVPWIEDRLYKAAPHVSWDTTTHGSVRPHGLSRPAPYFPIYRHFKVCSLDLSTFELDGHATRYKGHWENLEHRTGLAFRAERLEDLFVTSVPKYAYCTRWDGVFDQAWNMGEEYRPDDERPEPHLMPNPRPARTSAPRMSVAIGPRLPGFGSWEWVGADIAEELAAEFDVRTFDREIPQCDAVVFVKFKPDVDVLHRIAGDIPVVYAPVDFYGSAEEIVADRAALSCCRRILIHAERLRDHFAPYAPVEYMDHHVKFVAPLRTEFRSTGPLLWVGVRTNLLPLVEWVNRRRLPDELWVLTNPEDPIHSLPSPAEFGFSSHQPIRLAAWTPERQISWMTLCRAAIDVKGDDFRSRHKPPPKGIDFLASGVPLALQPDGSTAEHLGRLGFDVAPLGDWDRLYSRDYFDETVRFGAAIRELLFRGEWAFAGAGFWET